MISAVPSVSSVHVELDGSLPSTAGRTDVTTKASGDPRFMFVVYGSDLIVKVWFVCIVLDLDVLGFS